MNPLAPSFVPSASNALKNDVTNKNPKSNSSTEAASFSDDHDWDSISSDSQDGRRRCHTCSLSETYLDKPLKQCARCKSIWYCSRECQKTHWKAHKLTCGVSNDDLLGLTAMPEKDAFAILIDSYRLSVEDEYSMTGDVSMDSLYGGGNPLYDFRSFLNQAEKRDGVLPKWWGGTARLRCDRMARERGGWSDINCAVEATDIQEHYKDMMMPMRLRILSDKVYGGRNF